MIDRKSLHEQTIDEIRRIPGNDERFSIGSLIAGARSSTEMLWLVVSA